MCHTPIAHLEDAIGAVVMPCHGVCSDVACRIAHPYPAVLQCSPAAPRQYIADFLHVCIVQLVIGRPTAQKVTISVFHFTRATSEVLPSLLCC